MEKTRFQAGMENLKKIDGKGGEVLHSVIIDLIGMMWVIRYIDIQMICCRLLLQQIWRFGDAQKDKYADTQIKFDTLRGTG